MKKLLLILLSAVVVIGALAGTAYAGYRIGLSQGVRTTSNGDASPSVDRPNFDSERVPFAFDRGFERRFDRGFPPDSFWMTHRGGFGFFSPFMFLGHILFWGLIILLIYWLFTRSGWRLTRTEQTVQQTSPNVQTMTKIEEQESQNE